MAETKRVVVTGATGMIGKALCSQLTLKGYELVVLSRNPEQARQSVPGAAVKWNPADAQGEWVGVLDGAFGVIHLAGAPVAGKRWTEQYKAELRNSRVVPTRTLVEAMNSVNQKPSVFVCGSAIGYYGPRDDTELDETAPPGNDFLGKLGLAWEHEGARAGTYGIRTVLLRTGVVFDREAGALPKMVSPFRMYVGGPVLPGSQWFSWIHIDDEVGLILLALEDTRVSGPLNATAPQPQTNREFSTTIGKVLGKPSWLPVPGFALKILFGEMADTLTTGQRVIPRKALDLGYTFKFPTAEAALRDLLT
jgi:uncharacterized protein